MSESYHSPDRSPERQYQAVQEQLLASVTAQWNAKEAAMKVEHQQQIDTLTANFQAALHTQVAAAVAAAVAQAPAAQQYGPSPAPPAQPMQSRGGTPQPSVGSARFGRMRPSAEFSRLFQQLQRLKEQEMAQPVAKDSVIKAAALDKYSGEPVKGGKSHGYREWLQRYYSHPGQPTVPSLTSYLTGTASQWYTTQTSLRDGMPWTLVELVEALAIRFDDPSSAITARGELKSLKQGREDIVSFNQRYLEVASTAGAVYDADIIARYSGAVNAAAKKIIMDNKLHKQPGVTLMDVMAGVQEEIRTAEEFEAHIRSVTDGTTSRGCSISYSEPATTSDPMELGNMRMQQQFAGGQCFRCHGYGHWADECATPEHAEEWQLQTQCHKCKGWGHRQAECATDKQQQPRPGRPGQPTGGYQPPHRRSSSPYRPQQRQGSQSPRGNNAEQQSPGRWRQQNSGGQQANSFNTLRNYRPRGRGRGRGRQASN
jgi:hypothetical protein